jgi:hypothetical protein
LQQAYDEEEPEAYLLSKDLIAMSKRRPGEDVEVSILSDTADEDGVPPQDASVSAVQKCHTHEWNLF